jgi:group I intron endonuclease
MIKNEVNEKFYIGSSKNIDKRFWRHKNDLKTNKHGNIHLQRSYNKYGDVFSYIILENVEEEKLLDVEQTYLDKYKDDEKFYNIGLVSSGGDNLSNNPNREDIISRIKNTLHKKYVEMSVDERKEIFGKNGEKNPNFGNKWTEEMKEKASKRTKEYFKHNEQPLKNKTLEEFYGVEKAEEIKKKMSEHAKTRTGEKNPFYGKQHTEETKEILRKKCVGKYYGNQNIPFYIDDKKYSSLGEASKDLGIHITTIRHRLKSKNKRFDNYRYELINKNI